MGYDIPLFDLNYGAEEQEAVRKTLESKWISMGQQVINLEERWAKSIGVEAAIAVSSCTTALHLALLAVGVGEGDEVLVPSLTFVASVNCIRYCGATPVFVDVIGLDDLSMDPDDAAAKVTDKTKAILPVHYAGFGCPMDKIAKLAEEKGLAIVEDCAHTPDASFGDKRLGAWGDAGCFSFFSNKNITCAEGGIITTDNLEYAERFRRLRSHGMTTLSYERAKGHATTYDVIELGYNYRLDDIRGSLILAQLDKLEADTERRIELRKKYLELLGDIEEIAIPYRDYPYRSSNYIFPTVLKDSTAAKRDDVRDFLAEKGIQTSVHYPAAHRFSIYRDEAISLPHTDYVTDNEITLPFYFTLTEEQMIQVAEALKEALAATS